MKHWKHSIACLLSLALLLSVCGCGTASPETETLTLRLAYGEAPATLDPAFVTTPLEKTLVCHVFENLMKLTPNGVALGIARSYTCTDNLDGTESYTFQLRNGVQWYDGSPLTAQDFVYAWNRLVSPEVNSPNREILSVVAGYEEAVNGSADALRIWAEDSATLVVELNCHCPYFVTSICTSAVTMPMQKDVKEVPDFADSSIGIPTNGAYQVSAWQKDGEKHMLLTASASYYDKKHLGPGKLDFLFADTAQQAQQLYEAGEADFVMNASTADGIENAVSIPLPESTFLIVNVMADHLRQQAVRQAMSLVIDRNELATLEPTFIPADGLIPEGVHTTVGEHSHFREINGPLVDNDPEHMQDNYSAALELLSQTRVSTSYLSNMGSVSLLCQNTPTQYQLALRLQKMWQEKLGLNIVIDSVDQEEYQSALSQGEFSLAVLTVSPLNNDAWEYLKDFSTGKEKNYGLYSFTAYDLLMRTASQSDSAEARDAYLEDAERLLLESGYIIPLYCQETHYLLRPGLSGILENGFGQCCFHNVITVKEG